MKRLTFTVTNDLNYDQRMQRICSTLASSGYDVLLIGRKLFHSKPLEKQQFKQQRLPCFFKKGKLMYLEYNFRLFIRLLFTTSDCYCAIDLDTILPNYFVSVLKRKKRVYDAHELFTEQKEIISRPAIHKLWLKIEKFAVPKFQYGYTVNDFIQLEFANRYLVKYAVVRNLPLLSKTINNEKTNEPFIIYQGAINEGRSFETLIPAMQYVNAKLVICGDGNFFDQVKKLIAKYKLEHKIELRGLVSPKELIKLTPKASVAIMLFEGTGLNQFQSLANRFFDYIMAGVPQVCVNYPQYKAINEQYEVASLINNTDEQTIASAINNLLVDDVYHKKLHDNCLKASKELNWDNEKTILINFYNKLW